MVPGSEIKPVGDDLEKKRPRRPTRWTPLERSLLPSLVLTAAVLLAVMLLLRVRMPPLPYSLVIVLLLWLACFVVVYVVLVQRARK